MNVKSAVLLVVLGAGFGLSGCWESADIVVHEAGKYKGKDDPLLSQQASAREEALKKRFQLVQADR